MFVKDGGAITRQAHADGERVLPIDQDVVEASPGLVPADGTIDQPTGIPAEAKGLVVDQKPAEPKYNQNDISRFGNAAVSHIIGTESGGDARAQAKTSSAAGLGQFTDGTARTVIQRHPELVQGIDYDPTQRGFAATLPADVQKAMIAAHATDQASLLANQGFEPTPQNIKANWFLGESGGPAFLKGMQRDPSSPGYLLANPDQVKANQSVFFNRDGSPKTAGEVYRQINGGGGGEGAPKPPGVMGSTPTPRTEGDGSGLIDKATSSSFLVPALGFLGSMLASQRPTLGGALGEGLLGGTGAYMAQQKQDAAIAKQQAETGVEQAKIPYTQMQTKAAQAGLYERKWYPNRGWFVIDKSNPTSFIQVTDANLQPVAGSGFESTFNQIPVTSGTSQPAPSPSAQNKPSAAGLTPGSFETDITKLVPKSQNVMDWKPVTTVPDKFEPRVHMNVISSDEQQKAALNEGTKLSEVQTGKAEAASRQRMNLQQMVDSFGKLPETGFSSTGSGAEARLNAARAINTAYGAMTGKTLFDPNNVSAGEEIKKGSFRLGASLANSIGSREPGFIVAQSVQANPNIENSPTGFKMIASGLLQNALYEQDKKAFYDEYFSRFGHLKGASEAFDSANPPEMYAKRAVMSAIDPAVLDDVKRYKASDMQPIVDKRYGRGTYKILTGG
jgi:hypothetical protein